jgi:hypothetical protein
LIAIGDGPYGFSFALKRTKLGAFVKPAAERVTAPENNEPARAIPGLATAPAAPTPSNFANLRREIEALVFGIFGNLRKVNSGRPHYESSDSLAPNFWPQHRQLIPRLAAIRNPDAQDFKV